jgi:hypothetical protein
MFLKIWQGPWRTRPVPDLHVPINYVHQVVPSPMGMPPFELAKLPTKMFLSGDRLADVVQRMIVLHPATSVDYTGDRVNEFLKHIYLCEEFKCQRRLISISRSFTHHYPKFMESGRLFRQLFLQLSDLRAQNGFYQRAKQFQLEIAEIMRGKRPKACLLPLPAVKDDETTIKGTGGVVVKFFVAIWTC